MSTASGISVKTGDNEVKHVYNHCDGDLWGAGKTLEAHFNSPEKVKELVEHGNISKLHEKIHPNPNQPHDFYEYQKDVCVFYKRDRGDEGEEAEVFPLICAPNYEYNYYFDGSKWMFRKENQKRWQKLSTALKKEGVTS